VDLLTPEAVTDSIRVDNSQFVSAGDARGELEFFFAQLLALQPGLVGGKLPDAAFYRPAEGAATVTGAKR
jgi:NitT/TauT family transport system substrate-binding protein